MIFKPYSLMHSSVEHSGRFNMFYEGNKIPNLLSTSTTMYRHGNLTLFILHKVFGSIEFVFIKTIVNYSQSFINKL